MLPAYPKLSSIGPSDPDVFGWSNISVSYFCMDTEYDQAALQASVGGVVDRLSILNGYGEEKNTKKHARKSTAEGERSAF